MEQAHRVKWVDAGREPQCPTNPNYPDGIDVIEARGGNTCKVALPYPARRCGRYEVTCRACRRTIAVTTAGRPDDPRSVTMQYLIDEAVWTEPGLSPQQRAIYSLAFSIPSDVQQRMTTAQMEHVTRCVADAITAAVRDAVSEKTTQT